MKGIIFKPESIQAIVEGRKTQTRRVIKPQPKQINNAFDGTWEWKEKGHYYDDLTLFTMLKNSSRYHAGETVYIKEAYSTCGVPPDEVAFYKDEPNLDIERVAWRTPLFMPEKYARHFLKILAIRAERLQEITEEDVRAEGITVMRGTWQSKKWNADTRRLELTGERHPYTGRYHFEVIWNSINPKYPFDSNPWVFVYEFELRR